MSTATTLLISAAKPQQSSPSGHAATLLQRQCSCGSPTSSLKGEYAKCKNEKILQAQLTIGASNDPLEQEADRIANVLAAPQNFAVSSIPLRIQRQGVQSSVPMDNAPASVDRVLADPGSPMEPALRRDMERRFGYDFSRVRVHFGKAAEKSARDVNANAYTVGNNIVFGAGRFMPTTHEGRRLITHELTHVVQQSDRGPQSEDSLTMEFYKTPFTEFINKARLQRERTELGPKFNEAMNARNWSGAVRTMVEMSESDAHEALLGLNVDARQKLRSTALQLDPSPNNRVLRLIDSVETKAATTSPLGMPEPLAVPKSASLADAGSGPSGVLKIGNSVIGNGLPSLANVAGVLNGGASIARGAMTVNGTVLAGGAEVLVVEGGALIQTGEAVAAAEEVSGLSATLLRQTLALRAAYITASATRALPGTVSLIATAGTAGGVGVMGLGFSLGVGIVLLPFAITYAAQVLARLGPFGGTLPPGGVPTSPMQDPRDAGEAHAPSGEVVEPAKAPGTQQSGPALAPGAQGSPATAPGQPTTPAELGPGIQNVPKTKSDADAAAKKAREDFLKSGGQLRKFVKSPHLHHLFPEDARLQKYWDILGINNQDPKYLVWLNPGVHLKDVHGGHSDPGGLWNATWLEFFDRHAGATIADVLSQLAAMRKSFGI